MSLYVNQYIRIPESELSESFVRASGPGGQNVNKVSTAVQLRFDVENSSALPDAVKRRLKILARNRINDRGVLVISANRQRHREQNRQEARQRLVALIQKACIPPKKRIPTAIPNRAKAKRRQQKQHRSDIKRMRGRIKDSD